MEETDIGHRSTCKYFDVPVIWVEDIRLLPHGESQATPYMDVIVDLYPIQRKERRPSSSHTSSSTHSPSMLSSRYPHLRRISYPSSHKRS